MASLALLGAVAAVSLEDPQDQSRQTRAATSAAQSTLEQMLSYNYKTIDGQSAKVASLLTGGFRTEFTSAMDKDIKPLAVKNQTVVQAKVSDIGVMESREGHVKVMAFVNQAKVGADERTPAVDQNRVLATMSLVGDRWLVSRLEAF